MPDDFQYIKLPDGSYGKFAASVSDDVIRSAVSKDFPDAFKPKPPIAPTPLPGALQKPGTNMLGGYDLFKPMPSQFDKISSLFNDGDYLGAGMETIGDLSANATPLMMATGGESLLAGGLKSTAKQIGKTALRGAAGTLAGEEAGRFVGRPVGRLFGDEGKGEAAGSALGGLAGGTAALFSPSYMSRLPLGAGRMLMSDEEYSAAVAARKLSQRNADVAIGLRKPPNAKVDALFSPSATSTASGGYGDTPMELPKQAQETPAQQHILPDSMKPKGNAKSSVIVDPFSPTPKVKGSYWSFSQDALRKTVLSGDRDAAIVYKERFGDLPTGARYLTDVGANPNRGLYRSSK